MQDSRSQEEKRPALTAASVPPLRGLRSASSSGIIPPPAEHTPPAHAPEVAAPPGRTKPLFAIKPDGAQHSRLKSPVVQPVSSPENSPRAQDYPITLPKVTRKESNSSALGSPRTKLGQPVRGAGRDTPAEPPQSRDWVSSWQARVPVEHRSIGQQAGPPVRHWRFSRSLAACSKGWYCLRGGQAGAAGQFWSASRNCC